MSGCARRCCPAARMAGSSGTGCSPPAGRSRGSPRSVKLPWVRSRRLQRPCPSLQPRSRPRCRAVALGWPVDRVIVIDVDQGLSGASATDREGFHRLADVRPRIPPVAQVIEKHLQRALVVPDRRARQAIGSNIDDELLDRQRRPLPRPFTEMADRPTHQIAALLDRPLLEMPTRLLNPPAVQQRVEHGLG